MSTLSHDSIESLSYNELRSECKKAKIPANGKKKALELRLKEWATSVKENTPKKTASCKKLRCQLTNKLPWDPVVAEDGNVYERTAIEEVISSSTKHHDQILSPVTKKPMGVSLRPDPCQRETIVELIDIGVVEDELVEDWNNKLRLEEAAKKLKLKAENGEVDAMDYLGHNYLYGKEGFKKDEELALFWNEKAHFAGNARATVNLGYMHIYGIGVPKCTNQGMMYVSTAAGQGSDFAAYRLGKALASGDYGMVANVKEAIRWLQISLSGHCALEHLSEKGKKNAKEILGELLDTTN